MAASTDSNAGRFPCTSEMTATFTGSVLYPARAPRPSARPTADRAGRLALDVRRAPPSASFGARVGGLQPVADRSSPRLPRAGLPADPVRARGPTGGGLAARVA